MFDRRVAVDHPYDFSFTDIHGRELQLDEFRGSVLLMVNVASECGFTPQYAGLESLWRELCDQGLVLLGFPCNQFGAQEPGDEVEILAFCQERYQVSFPLTAKVAVNGPERHPLYRWLTEPAGGFGGDIEWNFEKFLLARNGRRLARYPSATTAQDTVLLQQLVDALEEDTG
jgi:glutathione peroxidase